MRTATRLGHLSRRPPLTLASFLALFFYRKEATLSNFTKKQQKENDLWNTCFTKSLDGCLQAPIFTAHFRSSRVTSVTLYVLALFWHKQAILVQAHFLGNRDFLLVHICFYESFNDENILKIPSLTSGCGLLAGHRYWWSKPRQRQGAVLA